MIILFSYFQRWIKSFAFILVEYSHSLICDWDDSTCSLFLSLFVKTYSLSWSRSNLSWHTTCNVLLKLLCRWVIFFVCEQTSDLIFLILPVRWSMTAEHQNLHTFLKLDVVYFTYIYRQGTIVYPCMIWHSSTANQKQSWEFSKLTGTCRGQATTHSMTRGVFLEEHYGYCTGVVRLRRQLGVTKHEQL